MTQTEQTDQLVRLSRAPKIVERITGERPHAGTIYRWASRGIRGKRLKTAYAGGHKRTSEVWIREFFDKLNTAAGTDSPSPVAKSKRRDQAISELARDGI